MKKISKVDIVYEYLMNEMVSLNYRAGDRLIINQVAEACNVSEIPVREALRRLESNGYVRIVPNQGAVAVGLDKNIIADIVQMKGVLEGFATRLAVDYLSDNDLKNLHKINEKLLLATKAKDYVACAELNKEFHLSIYKHIPQKELTNTIIDLWAKWAVTKKIFSVSPIVLESSYEEHEHILQLIKSHSYADVEMYVRAHKFKAIDSWIGASIHPNLP